MGFTRPPWKSLVQIRVKGEGTRVQKDFFSLKVK